jgi:hypothetical protein
MKNIHLLPTDKYSDLVYSTNKYGGYFLSRHYSPMREMGDSYQNIYITSDEEIKEGDWVLGDFPDKPIGKVISKYGEEFTAQSLNGDKYGLAQYDSKKIILTTDQDLIKDGVQSIDDGFLEWFVKNPNCEEVEVESWQTKGEWDIDYKIIIPKEEPKQIKCYCGHTSYCDCSPLEEPKQEENEIIDISDHDGIGNAVDNLNNEPPQETTNEEAAEKYARKQCDDMYDNQGLTGASWGWETSLDFIAGAKWKEERSYSEEEFLCFSEWVSSEDWVYLPSKDYWVNEEQEELEQKFTTKQLFEQFKKK